MDKGRKACSKLDETIVQTFPLESGEVRFVCYNAAISKRNEWTSILNSRICERKLQRLKKIVIYLLQQADKTLYYVKKVIKRDFKSI